MPRHTPPRHRRRLFVAAAAALAAVLALCVLYAFDPAATSWMPQCPSHWLTGYDCPGCGTLRAVHAILHGDIAAAWHYNAAVFFAVPLAIALAVAPHTGPRSCLRRLADSRWTPWAVFAALVAWTLVRNL